MDSPPADRSKCAPSRIAIFIPSLEGGGAERVTVTLCNALAARGHAIDLVLAKAKGPFLADLSPNVRMVDLGHDRVARSLPGLVRYLRAERPDALMSVLSHASVIARFAVGLARTPVRHVVAEHTTYGVQTDAQLGLRGRGMVALMRRLYPHAQHIITVSDGAANALATYIGVDRQLITTVYNPFDIEAIARSMSQAISHPWFQDGNRGVIVAIGRLSPEKDFATLLNAFAQVRSARPARLLILGEGAEREALEGQAAALALSSEDFQMPGFVQNPFAYLSRSDVFVLSSRYEGLPSAVVEALACEVPIVATDCPSGPSEILEGGRWGRLVPMGDAAALADAIVEALDENGPRRGRERASQFDTQKAVDGYLKVLLPHERPESDALS